MAARHSYDADKKVVGCNRHVALDTDGGLLMVNLAAVYICGSTEAQMIIEAILKRWPWIKYLLFADSAYEQTRLMEKATFLDFVTEVARRVDDEPGFKVSPRRWAVKRIFGRLTRWRRLVSGHKQRINVFEAIIHVVVDSPLLHRISY
jgi:hypothetical protein